MNDSAYTLHIDPIKKDRDKNGRFLERSTPWNKGLSWDEQGIPKKEQERRKQRFAEGARNATRPHKAYRSHPVIQMDEDGNRLHWYTSSNEAARKLGLHGRNIRKVCDGHRNHCGGFRWRWDEQFLN